MNATITDKRMALPATAVTVPIVSLSILPKAAMMMPTNAQSPARTASMDGLRILICWKRQVMMIPNKVATVVARRIGMKTSVGWAAP